VIDVCRRSLYVSGTCLLFEVGARLSGGSNTPSLGRGPMSLGSTAAHKLAGIPRSLWARWNSLDVATKHI